MAKKDLIIGAFKNYNYEQVKPWIESIKQTTFKGDKVLIAIDASQETLNKITQAGFTAIAAKSMSGAMFHMERFMHIYDFLKKHKDEYRYVVSTDVRDVIFQLDPMHHLEYILTRNSGYDLIGVSECIKIKDEHWNRDNILKCFGQYFYEEIKDHEVLNVGTLAGKSEIVGDLCGMLYQLSMNRADWVADQAAYNMLMSWYPYLGITYISGLNDGFCCNLHVTNKPDEKKHFAPFITEKHPIFRDGLMLTGDDQPYYIVHQYDRDPVLKKFYHDKYGVEELITFRTT
jgi:hypothetical protein